MRTRLGIGVPLVLALSVSGCATARRAAPLPVAAPPPAVDSPWPNESLPPSPALSRTEVKVIEVVSADEAEIRLRPWKTFLAGTARRGARLRVRGVTTGPDCAGSSWYAVEPFGFVCGADARPSDQPPTPPTKLEPLPGSALPFQYAVVLIPKGDDRLPLWASIDALESGAPPARGLRRGDAVAVERAFEWSGKTYWLSRDGMVIPSEGVEPASGETRWHGVVLEPHAKPIGWVSSNDVELLAQPPDGAPTEEGADAKRVAWRAPRRTQLVLSGETRTSGKRYLSVELPEGVAPGLTRGPFWVDADSVNEARWIPRPTAASVGERWVDVDVGEQVLVAYEGDTPVFATLVSTGLSRPTPTGTYPFWGAALAIRMSGRSYFLDKVPWAIFFQSGNALHAAYWHDNFGARMSHGCINMAPQDARRIFEWMVDLPGGWTGVRPPNASASRVIHVRDSADPAHSEQRPIGPPQPRPPQPAPPQPAPTPPAQPPAR